MRRPVGCRFQEVGHRRTPIIVAVDLQVEKSGVHWGAVYGLEGEPFFGQDRFEMLKWRKVQDDQGNRLSDKPCCRQ